ISPLHLLDALPICPELANQISSSSQRPNTVYEPPSLGVSSPSCAVLESAGKSTTGECSTFSGSGSADAPGATSRTAPRAPPAIAAHRVAVFFIALASLPIEPAAEVPTAEVALLYSNPAKSARLRRKLPAIRFRTHSFT